MKSLNNIITIIYFCYVVIIDNYHDNCTVIILYTVGLFNESMTMC